MSGTRFERLPHRFIPTCDIDDGWWGLYYSFITCCRSKGDGRAYHEYAEGHNHSKPTEWKEPAP